VIDRYIADLSVDNSGDRSMWIRMGKLRIDRPYLTDMENNQNRLRSADSKNPKIVCAFLMHRLCAADVGQNKRIVSAVADIRRVTTGSTNQPRVEAYQKKCIG
jgi:hypothetical protein